MVLPTVFVRNCYGTCSSRIYSGHRQRKSRLRKLRKAKLNVERNTGQTVVVDGGTVLV